ncbi:MAG TPA: NYN domain-containing protein [Patescibacteria group bacterium]|nr:NYN domain-containing protein [Patescibacteria group bacterium]
MDDKTLIKQKQRVAIFIDGSNFHYKLRDLNIPNITYFKYGDFSLWLARGRQLVTKKYYVGVVRAQENDEKGQKLRKNQTRLFNQLASKENDFVIERGYIMHHDGVFYEKGVDVKLAVDVVVGAYENLYDVAIIVSSDTDLIPAVQKVRMLGKEVEYVGFAHKPSFGMQKYVTLSKLLLKDEITQFVSLLKH